MANNNERRWSVPSKRAKGYAEERKAKVHQHGPKVGKELTDYEAGMRSGYLQAQSNKRSHSGDDSNEDPPVPIPNTEVKLVYVESTYTSRVGRIESCRISIKKACFSSKNRLFSCVFKHLTNFYNLAFDAC